MHIRLLVRFLIVVFLLRLKRLKFKDHVVIEVRVRRQILLSDCHVSFKLIDAPNMKYFPAL